MDQGEVSEQLMDVLVDGKPSKRPFSINRVGYARGLVQMSLTRKEPELRDNEILLETVSGELHIITVRE